MEIFNAFGSLGIGILVFIILLGPLMFIHELGHFWAAKKAGIRVEEFGMGFPPRAITLAKRGETTYSLNWLPIGAFVRMTGEDGANVADPRSFGAAKKRWRLMTLFAGPLMNFIGAFLILFVAYFGFAQQTSAYQYRITSVREGSPAAALGVQPGDLVVSANGIDMIQRRSDNPDAFTNVQVTALKQQALQSFGKPFTLVVARPADPSSPNSPTTAVTLKGTLPANADKNAPLGVGIGSKVLGSERVASTVPQAMAEAGGDLLNVAVGSVAVPLELIRCAITPNSCTIPVEQARPVSVVGITQMGVAMLDERPTQGLFPFIRFAGLISMVLGLTNLLPIPALDGGRILFVLIEWIRGKRVDPVREQWVHAVGMVILLGLSAVIIVLDIVRPINFR